MPIAKEDPVLVSGRREALAVLVIWLAAMSYTVTYCSMNGYGRSVEDLTFLFGFPDWVFWGVVAPWITCLMISWGFSYFFMKDADLGADQGEAFEGQSDLSPEEDHV